MQITGVLPGQLALAVNYANEQRYEGNLAIVDITDFHGVRRPRISARIGTVEGKGEDGEPAIGARRSWSGRRGPWACWHAFRDVLNVMFEQVPDAVVIAGIHWRVKYEGLDGFRETYPDTAYKNIGSQFQPSYMPELCACTGWRHDALSAPPAYTITFPI